MVVNLRRSRREVQRVYSPGTLFSFYASREYGTVIAIVMWWEPYKFSVRHPASWVAKCLVNGTLVPVRWERFNDASQYIEVVGRATQDDEETGT